MSQHDFNIANQTFPSFRSDLNDALQAATTISAGATAPTTPYAYQLWYDTANEKYMIRNAANTAWLNFVGIDTNGNVDVTGTVTADGLTVDGNSKFGSSAVIPVFAGAKDISLENNVAIRGTNAATTTAFELIKFNTSDQIVINNDGASAVLIPSGSVGIGTTVISNKISLPIGQTVNIGATAGTAHQAGNVGSVGLTITDGGNANGVRVHNTHNGTYSSTDIRFTTGQGGVSSGSERLRILSTGGITFNGDTAQANALDDYEEVTFTATLRGGTTEPSTLLTSTGFATKIGRIVQYSIGFENLDTTGYSGAITITGLPFVNNGRRAMGNFVAYLGATWSGNDNFTEIGEAVSNLLVYNISSNSVWVPSTHNSGSGGRYFWATGTYITS